MDRKLDELLDAVLLDPEREASIRRECLKTLAEHRRPRQAWWLVVAAAALLLLVFRLAHETGPLPFVAVPEAAPAYYVATQPLRGEHILHTPASMKTPYRIETQNHPASLCITERISADRITDEELLALFPGSPCDFKEQTPGKKEFYFLIDEEQERYITQL